MPHSRGRGDAIRLTFGEHGAIAGLAREINWAATPTCGSAGMWLACMFTTSNGSVAVAQGDWVPDELDQRWLPNFDVRTIVPGLPLGSLGSDAPVWSVLQETGYCRLTFVMPLKGCVQAALME
ncbi:hypothetical protein ACQP00_40695 [Dactylosporangium sp. CS-047395]|uniref:hypothetical protein n=1 Tax=Dactylosporangium sp. CS-047395 TaxID=3239936 RepID=UPI003D946024